MSGSHNFSKEVTGTKYPVNEDTDLPSGLTLRPFYKGDETPNPQIVWDGTVNALQWDFTRDISNVNFWFLLKNIQGPLQKPLVVTFEYHVFGEADNAAWYLHWEGGADMFRVFSNGKKIVLTVPEGKQPWRLHKAFVLRLHSESMSVQRLRSISWDY